MQIDSTMLFVCQFWKHFIWHFNLPIWLTFRHIVKEQVLLHLLPSCSSCNIIRMWIEPKLHQRVRICFYKRFCIELELLSPMWHVVKSDWNSLRMKNGRKLHFLERHSLNWLKSILLMDVYLQSSKWFQDRIWDSWELCWQWLSSKFWLILKPVFSTDHQKGLLCTQPKYWA